MTAMLGALFDEDGRPPTSWATPVAGQLVDALRAGVDFETAWARATAGMDRGPHLAPDEPSVWEFARARFELAYYGLNPSIRAHTWTQEEERE